MQRGPVWACPCSAKAHQFAQEHSCPHPFSSDCREGLWFSLINGKEAVSCPRLIRSGQSCCRQGKARRQRCADRRSCHGSRQGQAEEGQGAPGRCSRMQDAGWCGIHRLAYWDCSGMVPEEHPGVPPQDVSAQPPPGDSPPETSLATAPSAGPPAGGLALQFGHVSDADCSGRVTGLGAATGDGGSAGKSVHALPALCGVASAQAIWWESHRIWPSSRTVTFLSDDSSFPLLPAWWIG